jgi:hypothetical protein
MKIYKVDFKNLTNFNSFFLFCKLFFFSSQKYNKIYNQWPN